MKKAEPEVAFALGLQEETAGTANEVGGAPARRKCTHCTPSS